MANLTRWDPFGELTPLRHMMDRLMEDAWVRPGSWIQGSQDGGGTLGFDLYETGDEFVVTAGVLSPNNHVMESHACAGEAAGGMMMNVIG